MAITAHVLAGSLLLSLKLCNSINTQRIGKDRKGMERIGTERNGLDRIGRDRKGKERKGELILKGTEGIGEERRG